MKTHYLNLFYLFIASGGFLGGILLMFFKKTISMYVRLMTNSLCVLILHDDD